MSGKRYAGATIIFIFLTVHLTKVVYAQTDLSGTIVEGVVFEDLNNNQIRDEDEPGLSVIPLEFSDGSDRLIQIATGEDGTFLLQLEAGLWRVLVQPPSGFEIADTNGLEFLIEDKTRSVRLDIALTNMGILESETQDGEPVENDGIIEEETVAPLDDAGNNETEPPEGDDTQQEDNESQGHDGGFYLLPESGGTIPSRWIGLLVSIALLTASLIIISIGRKLIMGDDSSHGK